MAFVQRLVPSGVLVLVVTVSCGVAGFVYAHEPARDEVAVSVDHSRPLGVPIIVSGTVTRADDGRLVVDGAGALTDVALPATVPIEELQPIVSSALEVGAVVNVGAERSDYGVALTGVVLVGGR